jgi:ureidoglycolate dehydrogenase (NAD+)
MPAQGRAPLVIDLATAAVANGKVLAAKETGARVPPGWGLDAEGAETTDAARIATLLPLGAHKGAGLSLMIECLTSIVAMNPVIAPALRGELARTDVRMNGVAIAVDLAAFGDPRAIEGEVAEVASRIAAAPRAPGVAALTLPGERGDAIKARRLAEGIPLPRGTWAKLVAEAETRGVAVPAVA